MVDKIRAGVLGATGAVGQNYVRLLEDHPWFEVSYLAASKSSAGKTYEEAVDGRWIEGEMPANAGKLVVSDVEDFQSAAAHCDFVFSAIGGEKDYIKKLESDYAVFDIPVISNNSAHRWTDGVPMIIPEINPEHAHIISEQRKARGFKRGFITVKPNCSLQSFFMQVDALMKKGYAVDRLIVSTEQASSGAGYPGVPSLDLIDNVVPYIPGEEEKTEREPLKINGRVLDSRIVPYDGLRISATCTRVGVRDGHLALVNLGFKEDKPQTLEEIISIWENYRGKPQELGLPSAPQHPLIYKIEPDRPQPRKDRDSGNGMSVVTGRLRRCNVLDIKFVGLSHNTIRGAAGGAILMAELLKSEGYLG